MRSAARWRGRSSTPIEPGHYRELGWEFIAHKTVDHAAYQYATGDVTANHAEGYFSQLKRSLDRTHHHVSVEHLPRDLAEFDFRYSTRQATDTQRMSTLVGQVAGRRLTYRGVASSTS